MAKVDPGHVIFIGRTSDSGWENYLALLEFKEATGFVQVLKIWDKERD